MTDHIVRVIDFESTGLVLPAAEVCEVGICDVNVTQRTVSAPRSWLCGVREMPAEVRAVHHIRLEETEGFAPFDGKALMEDAKADGCFGIAAHNIEFEWQFFAPHVTLPMFCTHKSALRVWPDAPNHQNTTLRYWLEDNGKLHPEYEHELAMPPHRAGPDAYVTGHVMLALFEAGATGKEMARWTREPRLLPKCTIGKFRGTPWPDVEQGFLDWMLKQRDMESDLKWNAQRNWTAARDASHFNPEGEDGMPPTNQSRGRAQPAARNQTSNNGGTALAERPAPTQAQLMKVSVLHRMAARLEMHPERLQETLMATVFQGCSREEFAMLLVVADELKLNPLRKEIYAFPKKGGGIMPVVGIDGWITIVQSRPELDGFEFEDLTDNDGNIYAVQCTIHRSDRKMPTPVIEYLDECKRNTEPWNMMPTRMLRHKAFIQAARYTFGFSGIYDEEEVGLDGRDLSGTPLPALPQRSTDTEGFADPATRPNGGEQVDPSTGEVTDEVGEEEEGEHPAAPRAAEAIDLAGKAGNIIDLNNVKTRFHDDLAAMPDEMRGDVEAAYTAAETRLKAK